MGGGGGKEKGETSLGKGTQVYSRVLAQPPLS